VIRKSQISLIEIWFFVFAAQQQKLCRIAHRANQQRRVSYSRRSQHGEHA
jgi:hypothetical protein